MAEVTALCVAFRFSFSRFPLKSPRDLRIISNQRAPRHPSARDDHRNDHVRVATASCSAGKIRGCVLCPVRLRADRRQYASQIARHRRQTWGTAQGHTLQGGTHLNVNGGDPQLARSLRGTSKPPAISSRGRKTADRAVAHVVGFLPGAPTTVVLLPLIDARIPERPSRSDPA